MLVRMLRQSFFEGYRRKALAAATVALAATLITALFALSVDVGDKMAREMKQYGSNIRVTPKSETTSLVIGGIDYNPLKGRDYLNETDLPKMKDIFWRNNIVGLAPRLSMPVNVEGNGAASQIPLVGTYFDRVTPLPSDSAWRTGVKITNPFWKAEGAWPDDASTSEVLVGQDLAKRLGIGVGGSLILRDANKPDAPPRDVKVTGILASGAGEDQAIVAPLPLVQEMANLAGKVQSVDVSALTVAENDLSRKASHGSETLSSKEYDTWYCTAYVSAISHQIEEAVAGVAARPIWQVASGEGAVIGRIDMLLLVVSLAAIAAAAMAVAALTNTTVSERSKEIGLMKALGATTGQVYTLFMGEAIVVGLLGGALGLVLGYFVAQSVGWSVFGTDIEIQPITVPVVLFVSVMIVLIGSILPSRAIARLLPVEVLHGR
ncbi:ABC transporter permease [Rhodomicrobium sp.]|uniref:ABC transporter permease n=1 Tax=Rhodomicrobium sp. TaxID=2720632 RepID=UPI0039E29CE1